MYGGPGSGSHCVLAIDWANLHHCKVRRLADDLDSMRTILPQQTGGCDMSSHDITLTSMMNRND
jgi:hypothetical protein